MNIQTITYWAMGVVIVAALVVGGWFYVVTSNPSTSQNTVANSGFGVGDTRSVTVLPSGASTQDNTQTVQTPEQSSQKIFKVAEGPVSTATLIQTLHPTTTIARYVLQTNGHVFDLQLDNPGSVARTVSNTTIPGTVRGLWGEQGNGVVLQYLDSDTVKSLYLSLPVSTTTASSTKTVATRIQFLPDNIIDLAVSADKKSIAYLLYGSAGADGYIAKIDGGASKKLFSTPLSELLIGWPADKMILLQTKSAATVAGAVFSVNTVSGAISPLVYAPGVTAIADNTFSRVVYQTSDTETSTYVHDVKTGTNKSLSFNPIPEKCAWSRVSTSVIFCAAPLQYVAPNFLDLWHQGAASVPDALFAFNVVAGQSVLLASPGGSDGGVPTDIAEISVSPDDHYLLFIKKGDRSLWALRLPQ